MAATKLSDGKGAGATKKKTSVTPATWATQPSQWQDFIQILHK